MCAALFKRFWLVIVSLFIMGAGSVAIAQEYKFAYSVPYKSANFSKKPKSEDLQAAIDKAASEIWKKFLLSHSHIAHLSHSLGLGIR